MSVWVKAAYARLKEWVRQKWNGFTADLTGRLYLWLVAFLAVVTAALIGFWIWIRLN